MPSFVWSCYKCSYCTERCTVYAFFFFVDDFELKKLLAEILEAVVVVGRVSSVYLAPRILVVVS